jgi:predicted AAA+ superfamily ATPase
MFLRDSGLLHAHLGIRMETDIFPHPMARASWNGFLIEQVLALVQPDEAWHWATHQGASLDLLVEVGGKRYGIDINLHEAPRPRRGLTVSQRDLELEHVTLLYPGAETFEVAHRVVAVPVMRLCAGDPALILDPLPDARRPGRKWRRIRRPRR